jgi:hypothetical protein
VALTSYEFAIVLSSSALMLLVMPILRRHIDPIGLAD